MFCMCPDCTAMFHTASTQVVAAGSWAYQRAAVAGNWLYSWGPWTREQLSSRYPSLYDDSCKLAKWLTLNVANTVYVGTEVISMAGTAFLLLRIFDRKGFADKLGKLTAGFWEAPDTVILTLVSMLWFCGRPLGQIFGPSGGKQYIWDEILRIVTGAGVASYLVDIYQIPQVVKYVLIVLISAPFILLLFCILGEKINSKKIKAYVRKLKEWIEKGAWSGAWVNGANLAQAIGAGITAAITFWYDASHHNDLASEKTIVLIGAMAGLFAGSVAVCLEKTRGIHIVKTVFEVMEKFSLSFFYLINYFLVFYEAANPGVLSARGFDQKQDTGYSISGLIVAAAMTATSIDMWLPRMPKTPAQYPAWSDIRRNPLLAIQGFTAYFRHCVRWTISCEQAQQPLLPQFGPMPEEPAHPLAEPLLPSEEHYNSDGNVGYTSTTTV